MQRRTLPKRWWLVFLAVAAMLLMGSSSRTHAAGQEIPAGLTAPLQPVSLPAFRLPRVGGTTLSAADLRGKVVLMRFWATW